MQSSLLSVGGDDVEQEGFGDVTRLVGGRFNSVSVLHPIRFHGWLFRRWFFKLVSPVPANINF